MRIAISCAVAWLGAFVFSAGQSQTTAQGQVLDSKDVASKAAVHEAELLQKFPPPGDLVDIGGRRLHILCKGQQHGPVVIIEGGAFASSFGYWKTQDEIAKTTRVCTYDRAGLGWSDAAPLPRTLSQRADDLHALLHAYKVPVPYMLVGHSMGGLLVRVYAHKYPQDVASLVLVEPSNEKVNATESQQKRAAQSAEQIGMALPVLAAGGEIPQLRMPNGPPEQDIIQRVSAFRAGQDDLLTMSKLDVELKSLGQLGTLGSKPLVVITRGKRDPSMTEEVEKEWHEAHRWLATLSTRSQLIVAENSGHMVNIDQPELIATAVRQLLGGK